MLPLSAIEVTFDRQMLLADPSDPSSVLHTGNYTLTRLGNVPAPVQIGAVQYRSDTQTAVLSVNGLQAGPYQLIVDSAIRSAENVPMQDDYSATFRAASRLLDVRRHAVGDQSLRPQCWQAVVRHHGHQHVRRRSRSACRARAGSGGQLRRRSARQCPANRGWTLVCGLVGQPARGRHTPHRPKHHAPHHHDSDTRRPTSRFPVLHLGRSLGRSRHPRHHVRPTAAIGDGGQWRVGVCERQLRPGRFRLADARRRANRQRHSPAARTLHLAYRTVAGLYDPGQRAVAAVHTAHRQPGHERTSRPMRWKWHSSTP